MAAGATKCIYLFDIRYSGSPVMTLDYFNSGHDDFSSVKFYNENPKLHLVSGSIDGILSVG